MEYIEVEDMKIKHEKNKTLQALRDKLEQRKAQQTKPKAIPMSLRIKSATRAMTKPSQQPVRKTEIKDKEVFEGIRKVAIRGMAMPMKTEKRNRLCKKLEESDYITKYFNNHIYTDYIDTVSDHYKMMLVYGYHFMDVLTTDEPQPVLQLPD